MRSKLLIGLVLVLAAAVPAALAYDALYAFGDSLTDTGREPAEPYFHYNGRWSNGPLWVEYLSVRLGFPYNPDNNLAHSGAQTDDTFGQVRDFVPTTDVGQSLFVVWAGGNDFLQEYDTHWFDDDSWDRQIAYSVGNLSNAVVSLYAKGARFILVPNTVDVTDITALNWLPGFLRDYLRGKVQQFNRQLAEALDQIRLAYPALTLAGFDIYGQVKLILSDASAYGFTETRTDALSDVTLLDKSFDGPGANYVFWDPIHPTTKSHGIIADWYYAVVAPWSAQAQSQSLQGPRLGLITSNGTVRVTLGNLQAGQVYTVQASTDLVAWADVATVDAANATQEWTEPANDSARVFFRLKF